MRRTGIALALVCSVIFAGLVLGEQKEGVRMKDGLLTYSASHYLHDQPLPLGYDPYGYNYQAHMFNGLYVNYYIGRLGLPPYEGDDDAYLQRLVDEGFYADRDAALAYLETTAAWLWDYRNDSLIMAWNDAWLANMDRDEDGALDRHYGFASYIGCGAWLTNHMQGEDENGTWTYFTKIVAAPADAVLTDGIWYAADGTEIGPVIWGDFAIIQEVESGAGATYVSPIGPGFGKF